MALQNLQKAYELNEEDNKVANNLAVMLMMSQKLEESRSILGSIVKRDALNFTSHFNYAVNFYLSKDYPSAITALEKYLSLYPLDSSAYYLIGRSEEALGNDQKAIESYLKAIDVDKNNSEANLHLAALYFNKNNKNEARKHIN